MIQTLQKLLGITCCVSTLVAENASAEIPTDAREVNPVEVGSTAPNVSLTRADGSEAKLHELLNGQGIALVFYRGGWCPYCNEHLSGLGEVEKELQKLGFQIHAVSTDQAKNVMAAEEKSEYQYTLYSDATASAAQAFGLAFRVDSESYQRLLGFGINLEEASGQDHHLLPVPAVFLIDRKGRIGFRHFNADYKKRLENDLLLQAARDISQQKQ